MGNKIRDNLFHGTNGNPQLDFEQEEFAVNNRFVSTEIKQDEIKKDTKNIKKEDVDKNNKNVKFDSSLLNYDDSKSKIETYLLDINHPVGGPKANFFINTLGYKKENSKDFFNSIKEIISSKTPIKITNSKYGLKYEFHEKMKGVNGKEITARVIVIVQKDNGKTTFRIISAYPNKKEDK